MFFHIYCYTRTISNLHRRFRRCASRPSLCSRENFAPRPKPLRCRLRSTLYRLVVPRRAGIFVIWIPVLAARKVGRSSSRRWRWKSIPRGRDLLAWCSCRNEHGIVLGTKVPGRVTSTGLPRKSRNQQLEAPSSRVQAIRATRLMRFQNIVVRIGIQTLFPGESEIVSDVYRETRSEWNMLNALLEIEP